MSKIELSILSIYPQNNFIYSFYRYLLSIYSGIVYTGTTICAQGKQINCKKGYGGYK